MVTLLSVWPIMGHKLTCSGVKSFGLTFLDYLMLMRQTCFWLSFVSIRNQGTGKELIFCFADALTSNLCNKSLIIEQAIVGPPLERLSYAS